MGLQKLQPGSKSTNAKVDHPRVSVLAGTTPEDLREHFPTEWLNDGTANRFLWIRIRVMPPQPDGGPTAVGHCPREIQQLHAVFGRFASLAAPIEMQRTQQCIERWRAVYSNLKKRGPYKVTHRTEAHILRIAVILALCDNRTQVDIDHLEAAIRLYNYSSQCARAIFHPQKVSDEAMQIVEFLRNRGATGATRSEIHRAVFQGHVRAKDLIGYLKETLEAGFTRTEGKRPERWYALDVVDWNPTQEPTDPNTPPPSPRADEDTEPDRPADRSRTQDSTSVESLSTCAEPSTDCSKPATDCATQKPTAQAKNQIYEGESAELRKFATSLYIHKNLGKEDPSNLRAPATRAVCGGSVGSTDSHAHAHAHAHEGHFFRDIGNSANLRLSGGSPSENPVLACVVPKGPAYLGSDVCATPGGFAQFLSNLDVVLARIRSATRVALDTETVCEYDISDRRYILEARIRLLSLKVEGHPSVVLDLFEVDNPAPIREALAGKDLVIYNSFFDLPILARNLGGPIAYRNLFDPMIAAVLIDNVARPREDDSGDEAVVLPSLADVLYKWTDIQLDKRLQDSDWAATVLDPEQVRYAALDTEHLLTLATRLGGELDRTGLTQIADLEFGLVPVTVSTLEHGVYVDGEALVRIKSETEPQYREMYERAQRLLGVANPISPLQVTKALQQLGYTEKPRKGDAGRREAVPIQKANKRALKRFVGHGEADLIRELRGVKKVLEQCEAWEKAVATYGSSVYVGFKQLGTITGRYSASNPPFQQLKKGSPRELIAAPPGYTLVDFDFKVIEVLCAGVIYKEPRLLEIIRSGDDIYCVVAAMVLGAVRAEITDGDPRRKFGKILVLSLNYCKWVETFVEDCRLEGVPYDDAELERMYEKYFELFPGIRRYQQEQDRRAQAGEEARSVWGRRTIMGPGHERWQMRNKLTNHPVQMTCSDLLKAVMVELFRALAHLADCRIVASVHDEVLCVVPDALVQTVCRLAQQICARIGTEMLGADVPVRIDITVGKNWWDCGQAKPIHLSETGDSG
jgi:DNA polymerase I-like protein with 3'-5' exonuclease and polymerase domains